MRILFLAQIIPYPPDAGPKVKTWHVLRYLVGKGHQVTLVAFVRAEEEKNLEPLQNLCYAVHTVPIRRSRIADVGYMLRSFLSGVPFLIERDNLRAMREVVARLIAAEPFEIIHADQLTMVQFGLGTLAFMSRKAKIVFDAHNATWTIVERMVQNAAWHLKPVLKLEALRVKRYEGQLLRQVDGVLAVTDIDKKALLECVNHAPGELSAKISVIPIAVDTQQIQPIQRKPGSKAIFTLGTLHYPPNADGIRWFLQQVLPLIRQQVPDASLTIAGKNPPEDFLELARQNPGWIRVTGYVPDLKPYLEQSALVVVPVRAGGGMRVRILEAFAYGMPVVTTTVGLEGISATTDREVIVADAPADFAERVVQLLKDESLQSLLSEKGRLLAETRYDWQVVLSAMDKAYAALDE
jgi:glycosyltransferase involved in cell wall biosynthesis